MRRALLFLGLAAGAAAGLGVWLTAPSAIPQTRLADLTGDADAGALVFHAAGCASCHAAPESDDTLVLAGGERLESDFGTFVAPNISSHPEHGIGAWSQQDFANAVLEGVSPAGAHYYPAFPYAAYVRMTAQDVVDLWAFMQTLPAADTPSQPHDLAFPFTIRRAVGAWKMLYMDPAYVTEAPTATLERGRYLVESLAHCAECHTPRDALGGLDESQWMAGAPNPSGRGQIPGLRAPAFDWVAEDIVYYFESGFTPEFDSVGGSMKSVVDNISQLPASDREAIAAYITALPPLETTGE